MLVDDTGAQLFPGHTVSVVDTTAAGDSFVGAFAFAVASGKSTHEAITLANAAGALATMKLGAQTSIPTSKAVTEFLSSRESFPARR
jgi:ribokinase